jgi:hypothetical protein
MKTRLLPALLHALLLVSVGWSVPASAAPPSHFGTTVGYTLLCLNALDEIFFYNYLKDAFGKPYKHEAGAWWFKANAILWGLPVIDVLVSDSAGNYTFLAAVIDATPQKLEEAIFTSYGVHHAQVETNRFPVRQARPGSQIIHFQQKSKIFCAKSRYLVPD